MRLDHQCDRRGRICLNVVRVVYFLLYFEFHRSRCVSCANCFGIFSVSSFGKSCWLFDSMSFGETINLPIMKASKWWSVKLLNGIVCLMQILQYQGLSPSRNFLQQYLVILLQNMWIHLIHVSRYTALWLAANVVSQIAHRNFYI